MSDLRRVYGFDSIEIVDEREEYVLTNKEAEIVNICNKIRKIALTGKIKIDTSAHTHSDNQHLFRFIEMCGFTLDGFIRSYLASIQPYMIVRDSTQDVFDKDVRCLIDVSYKVPMYLKINLKQHNEYVISFHEDQSRYRFTKQIKKTPKYSVLISDKVSETSIVPDKMVLEEFIISIPKGFIKIVTKLRGVLVKEPNVFKVSTQEVNQIIYDEYNKTITNLFDEKLYNLLQVNDLKNLTFTSYGENELKKISLIIDSIASNRYLGNEHILFTELNMLLNSFQTISNSRDYFNALRQRYNYMLDDKNISDSYKIVVGNLFDYMDNYLGGDKECLQKN